MRRFGRLTAGLAALILSAGIISGARAADAPVAVAANFTEPAKEIAAAFQKATGTSVSLSFGASGDFYAELAHGAPFEVFLSADAERPRRAEAEGFAAPGARFTYAIGRLVLYSKDPGLVDERGEVLGSGRFHTLAIADPAIAPYGEAAIQTLTRLGLYDRLRTRIVQGASIAQAYAFTATGAAELGFVAQSQVINTSGGSRWLVPERLHAPIVQDAVLLKRGENDPAARAFFAFLKSPTARAIIKRYGYDVP